MWSTFEHVDNVPPAGAGEAREPDAKDAGAPYAYFDPSRPARLWPPFGSAGASRSTGRTRRQLHPTPMQVVRRYPIHGETMAMNRAYWALPGIKGTVWEHYMLVAAQWPTSADPPAPTTTARSFPAEGRRPTPPKTIKSVALAQENLINTTMETYLQDAPSSCMACHQIVSNSRGAISSASSPACGEPRRSSYRYAHIGAAAPTKCLPTSTINTIMPSYRLPLHTQIAAALLSQVCRATCQSAFKFGSDSNLMVACENRGVRRKRMSLK